MAAWTMFWKAYYATTLSICALISEIFLMFLGYLLSLAVIDLKKIVFSCTQIV